MITSSSLRVAVLGTDKIGSTFAFQLARVGHHDVTVVARPGSARLQQLQRDGGIVNVNVKGERAEVRFADTLDEQMPYDLIIVTLLAHQTDTLLSTLQRSRAKCIQFMFNCFEPEQLQDAIGVERCTFGMPFVQASFIGVERCTFGMPFVQASFDGDGKLKADIGAAGQKTLLGQPRWVEVFNAAGMPAALEPDMPLWPRCHAPLCVAFESVSVAGERRGGGASWGEAVVLARGLHENFVLIKALGYRVYPRSKARLNGCPVWVGAAMLWTLSRIPSFRELPATGVNECRALVDAMVAASTRTKPLVGVSEIQAMKPA